MLSYACGDDNKSSILKQILDHTQGLDVNAVLALGGTLLHEAATQGWTRIVSSLLSRQADPTVRRQADVWMPIHCAAANGHLRVAIALLDTGCDAEAKDHLGLTPELTAYENGHLDVAAAIESYANNQGTFSGSLFGCP